MAQQFTANNTSKFAIGRQTDVALASGESAPSATLFVSLTQFEPQNAPEPQVFEDAEGNRSSSSDAAIGERSFPFVFAGSLDVDKVARFLFLVMGSVTSVQDGATGAWTHTFTPLNNVILPPFTMFFNTGSEGYRRITGCHISQLTLTVTDTEATFSGEGFAKNEDAVLNSTTSVSTLTITDVTFQTDGTIRYQFSGAPDLSSVENGDVLVTETTTLLANNQGSHIIVNVNDTSDFIDVINDKRSDGTDDETTISSVGNSISIIIDPSYPEPERILLRRHSGVKNAVNVGGLAAATLDGLRNFTLEYNNNSAEIREEIQSPNPVEVFAKNISITLTFTQLMKAKTSTDAITFRDGQSVKRAFRLELEDLSSLIGTSLTVRPKIQITVPEGLAIATRGNQHTVDELIYDWAVTVTEESGLEIIVQNALSDTDITTPT